MIRRGRIMRFHGKKYHTAKTLRRYRRIKNRYNHRVGAISRRWR